MSSGDNTIISIEEFSRLDLRVAVVVDASRIPNTGLLRLKLDVGDLGERQVIAGIGKWYSPEDLIGKRVIVVANLKPKTIRGYVSQGMILAAGCDDGAEPVVLTIDNPEKAKPGSKVC